MTPPCLPGTARLLPPRVTTALPCWPSNLYCSVSKVTSSTSWPGVSVSAWHKGAGRLGTDLGLNLQLDTSSHGLPDECVPAARPCQGGHRTVKHPGKEGRLGEGGGGTCSGNLPRSSRCRGQGRGPAGGRRGPPGRREEGERAGRAIEPQPCLPACTGQIPGCLADGGPLLAARPGPAQPPTSPSQDPAPAEQATKQSS